VNETSIRALRSDDGVAALARVFHALSDETRLRIVGRLLTGEQCVCDLAGALGAAQSRLSFHMKALKDAGLVTDRREGRWIHYAIVPDAIQQIERFLSNVAARAAKCCG
jgi:ArsR family transcriptional regulator